MPANTLLPIELDPNALAHLDFAEFCDKLIEKLSDIKTQRFAWYDNKRDEQSKWVNGSRRVLATLGSVAILLTAMGTTLRIVDVPHKYEAAGLGCCVGAILGRSGCRAIVAISVAEHLLRVTIQMWKNKTFLVASSS
ncbi:MAG TPA: hypothetical protein VM910_32340 [Bradyrhizobium sp.]|jgi:hypothetical protein|nr:hypothetical protein [Bradyrhizobium sp.]